MRQIEIGKKDNDRLANFQAPWSSFTAYACEKCNEIVYCHDLGEHISSCSGKMEYVEVLWFS